jgi:hypothetical protein
MGIYALSLVATLLSGMPTTLVDQGESLLKQSSGG